MLSDAVYGLGLISGNMGLFPACIVWSGYQVIDFGNTLSIRCRRDQPSGTVNYLNVILATIDFLDISLIRSRP